LVLSSNDHYHCTVCGTWLTEYQRLGKAACEHWHNQAQGNCSQVSSHGKCDGIIKRAGSPPCVCSCHLDSVVTEVITEEQLAHVAMKLADMANELNRREQHGFA
jgi:hypothetical protein